MPAADVHCSAAGHRPISVEKSLGCVRLEQRHVEAASRDRRHMAEIDAKLHQYAQVEQGLTELGYRLVEDSWEKDGRRTYIHDDDVTQQHLNYLFNRLRGTGWTRHRTLLRAFQNDKARTILEIEPGGSGVTGHFLHLLKDMSGRDHQAQ